MENEFPGNFSYKISINLSSAPTLPRYSHIFATTLNVHFQKKEIKNGSFEITFTLSS